MTSISLTKVGSPRMRLSSSSTPRYFLHHLYEYGKESRQIQIIYLKSMKRYTKCLFASWIHTKCQALRARALLVWGAEPLNLTRACRLLIRALSAA